MTTGTLVTGDANGEVALEDAGQGTGEPASGASTTAGQEGGETTAGGEGADSLGGDSQPGTDTQAGGEGADSVAGAPDEYADFIVPEGVVMDDAIAGDFKALAKELNLPQDAAQKVFDLGVTMSQKWAEGHSQALSEMRDGWVESVKADPEIGGAKLTASTAAAQKAVQAFGSDALRDLLNTSGLGNHPEIVRFAAAVGNAISADGIVTGGDAGAAGQRDARSFYPNTTMEP